MERPDPNILTSAWLLMEDIDQFDVPVMCGEAHVGNDWELKTVSDYGLGSVQENISVEFDSATRKDLDNMIGLNATDLQAQFDTRAFHMSDYGTFGFTTLTATENPATGIYTVNCRLILEEGIYQNLRNLLVSGTLSGVSFRLNFLTLYRDSLGPDSLIPYKMISPKDMPNKIAYILVRSEYPQDIKSGLALGVATDIAIKSNMVCFER